MTQVILDVRERDEFEAEHVAGSINVPLSYFAVVAPGVLHQLSQRDLLILCHSGTRARLALVQIEQIGYGDKVRASAYEGGILEWKRAGRPTIRNRRSPLSIMRQVQLIAGLLVFATTLLGAFVNPWFLSISAFVGAGLTVAGMTGFCGMAVLLSKMPWNVTTTTAAKRLCESSSATGSCNS